MKRLILLGCLSIISANFNTAETRPEVCAGGVIGLIANVILEIHTDSNPDVNEVISDAQKTVCAAALESACNCIQVGLPPDEVQTQARLAARAALQTLVESTNVIHSGLVEAITCKVNLVAARVATPEAIESALLIARSNLEERFARQVVIAEQELLQRLSPNQVVQNIVTRASSRGTLSTFRLFIHR